MRFESKSGMLTVTVKQTGKSFVSTQQWSDGAKPRVQRHRTWSGVERLIKKFGLIEQK